MIKNLIFISLTVVAAFLFKTAGFKFGTDKTADVEEEVKVTPKKKKREPASVKPEKSNSVPLFKPEMSQSNRRASDFAARPEDFPVEPEGKVAAGEEEVFEGGGSFVAPSSYSPSRGSRGPSSSSNGRGSSTGRGAGSAASSSGARALGPFPGGGLLTPPNATKPTTPTTSSNDNNTAGPVNNPSPTLNCSANIGGGAYSNPLSVALTCSAAADIKYCVGSGGICCDPEVSGVSYTSNVVIGATDGNFCLSFIGETYSGVSSTVVQQNYIINNELPHLEASQPIIFYQTTELAGQSHIASDDFGKLNFGVGLLNLMQNDPGPTGMNLECDEIVTNYVTFPAPAPVEILSFFDTSGVASTSQLDVPLVLSNLGYGENYLTTYMRDTNYAAPIYSCSTTKVTLEDFPYFQADIYHGDAGSNTVREFEGGFVAYGFFEEETNVYRGPAGSSTEDASGQKLESGLLSVFY